MSTDTITNPTEIKDEIQVVDEANQLFTPYQCATVVNSWLKEQGFERKVAPQMLYNYVKNDRIESTWVEDKRYVEHDTLAKWYVAYVKKNVLPKSDMVIPKSDMVIPKSDMVIPSAPELD